MTPADARAIAEVVKGWTSSGPVVCSRCELVGSCNVIAGRPTCADCMTDLEVVSWAETQRIGTGRR